MSAQLDEFTRLLRKGAKSQVPIQTEWCVVKEVDWNDKKMTAESVVTGIDYFDVLLGLGSIYKKPVVGKKVIIGIIGNSTASFMIDCEAFEEMTVVSKDSFFSISEEGFIVKQKAESLQKILNDLIDEINKIIVVNGTSINVAEMLKIKQRLNQVIIE